MNPEQIKTSIERLMIPLVQYQQRRETKITVDDKLLLKAVYAAVYPNSNKLSVSCGSCVIHYLEQLQSYYAKTFVQPAPAVEEPKPKKIKTKS